LKKGNVFMPEARRERRLPARLDCESNLKYLVKLNFKVNYGFTPLSRCCRLEAYAPGRKNILRLVNFNRAVLSSVPL
jgi:hypothetical protein